MASAELVVVVMDKQTGIWCPDCCLPSGVTVTIAAGLRLMDITRCTECLDWRTP